MITEVTAKDESKIVLIKLLIDFMKELAIRYVDTMEKVKNVLYVSI